MIKITPMEEFYLSEITKEKPQKQIAKENGLSEGAVSLSLKRCEKRLKLTKLQLIIRFLKNEYIVVHDGNIYKKYNVLMQSEEAKKMKQYGFTDIEIIKELRERAD